MTPDCAYCTDAAVGLDEDGEYTCDADSCTPAAEPLPRVIEASDEDEDEEDES